MIDSITQFVSNLFGNNVVIATIFIAIIPLIELKGAIPFGTSTDFWGEFALSAWQAYFYSLIGGLVITIILAFIFKPIYNAIKDKKFFSSIVHFFTDSLNKKSQEINEEKEEQNEQDKNNNAKFWKRFFVAFVFTALPIPGTGVYTGTALAILLGLSPLYAIISVTLGNILAGAIIMTICQIFPAFSTILFLIFLGLILALLVYKILVHIIKNKKDEPKE